MKFEKIKANVVETPSMEMEIFGETVAIKQYLPMEDKLEIVTSVIQGCFIDGKHNPLIEEIMFSVQLVMKYTDITFSDSDLEDILAVYDVLEENDVINKVISYVAEYSTLYEMLQLSVKEEKEYKKSFIGVVEKLIEIIPGAIKDVKEQFEGLGVEKMAENLYESLAKKGVGIPNKN